ncbi:hypothetical protein H4R35_005769 [Dimargaris xerosporica]|nr:hypothetical protein H4R35_005769 [Dimargaris xerosporica]
MMRPRAHTVASTTRAVLLSNPISYGVPTDSESDSETSDIEYTRHGLFPKLSYPLGLSSSNVQPFEEVSSSFTKRTCAARQRSGKSAKLGSVAKFQQESEITQRLLQSLALSASQPVSAIDDQFNARNTALTRQIAQCLSQCERIREERHQKEAEKARQAQLEAQKKAREAAEQRAQAAVKPTTLPPPTAIPSPTPMTQNATPAPTEASSAAVIRSDSSVPEVEHYRARLMHLKNVVRPAIKNNPALKTVERSLKKEMNLKVGQLVNIRSSILKTANDINNAFMTARSKDAQLYEWALNLAAKVITSQAEVEVQANHSMAYPLAHVCVLLFQSHPEFVDTLMARLVKKCPYVVPQYFNRQPTQSMQEYRKLIGYPIAGSEEWETREIYFNKMGGLLALYAAIVQTAPIEGSNAYGIHYGWRWLARILNLPPQPITGYLLIPFLKIAGATLIQAYQGQARKLIQVLHRQFMPQLTSTIPYRAAKEKLGLYLERYSQSNGMLERTNGYDYQPS